MKVTTCDVCGIVGNDSARIYRWVEIRWTAGKLADFLGAPNRRRELCEDCFDKVTALTPPTTPS